MSLSPYLMNVALHAVLLSAAASLALVFVRKPARRGVLALAAVISVGVLPWVSPLLPGREAKAPAEVVSPASADLAAWKVFTIPVDDTTAYEGLAENAAPLVALPSARTLAAWAWLGGTCLGLVAIAGSLARLGRWRAALEKPHPSQAEVLGDALPPGLAVEDILLSKEAGSPCVAGFRRPLMVLPESLLGSCSTRELGWVLRHEQGHLEGKDSRWMVLMALVRVVFWWNPLVHHLAKRWAAAREEVCDLHAEASERSAYSVFLVRMAAAYPGGRMLAAAMASGVKRRLRRRIVSLLNAPASIDAGTGPWFASASVVVLLACGVCASCVRIGGDGSSEAAATGASPSPEVRTTAGKGDTARFQLKISHMVLFTTEPLAENGKVLGSAGYGEVMRKAAGTKGNRLINFPAITTRPNESGSIDMTHEKPVRQGQERVIAGWNLRITPRWDGKTVSVRSGVRYGFVPNGRYAPTSEVTSYYEESPRGREWNRLVVKQGNAEANKIREGEFLVTTLGEVGSGLYGTIFTKIEPIDRGGLPIALKDAPHLPDRYPGEKEEVPVSVRVRGILLENLEDGEVSHIAPSFRGIFTKDQWKRVQAGMGGKELGEFTLESGREMQPWEAAPRVKLKVRRLKGESRFELWSGLLSPTNRDPYSYQWQAMACEPGWVVVMELPATGGGKRRGLAVVLEEMK
ncbi:M56 family metallopeptidase [Luteolibacter sp. Populi]|uniref:M56 family metallopeptidase n=1 Tax=Luteolibacter sp. Populi TaxID=3230487 RepID=UPI003466C18F